MLNLFHLIRIQTHLTQIVKSIFLFEKPTFIGFIKIIGVQNQLPFPFCSYLLGNKALKVRNSTPTHKNFFPLIYFYITKSHEKKAFLILKRQNKI